MCKHQAKCLEVEDVPVSLSSRFASRFPVCVIADEKALCDLTIVTDSMNKTRSSCFNILAAFMQSTTQQGHQLWFDLLALVTAMVMVIPRCPNRNSIRSDDMADVSISLICSCFSSCWR